MHDIARLLQAAAALSELLQAQNIPHAFYGSVFTSILANNAFSDEIFCIVEGGSSHPFRRVRQAVAGSEKVTTTASPWCNRLHATYHGYIPPIEVSTPTDALRSLPTDKKRAPTGLVEIEILPAGEEGPRRLDSTTTMSIKGIPFLTISEFIRAKLKAWTCRGLERDAQDIAYVLARYWNRIDINRVSEDDMNNFVSHYPSASAAWTAIQSKYGM